MHERTWQRAVLGTEQRPLGLVERVTMSTSRCSSGCRRGDSAEKVDLGSLISIWMGHRRSVLGRVKERW
ncbi:extensin-like [Iris pallida]|uniref:Extensin-like n=1 Tax=Iris pallida TaxID=29817 RepID=A0AAX6GEH8_IRIPA|nr:extensin-like [Iris pallida]